MTITAADFAYPNRRPSERGWGPGYPNCAEEAWVPLMAANGVPFGRVHKNVHKLLELILAECIRRGYAPKAGQCWGAVCRCSHRSDGTCAEDAQGNPVPSNHSWGLAIDFNSIDNPYGAPASKAKLAQPQYKWVSELFRTYGFRWLGPPIDDWQHFDFAGTKEDAAEMTAKAMRELEEDVSTQDMREGSSLFRAGKPLPDDANADFRFGYNLERRIQAASETPRPGAPGPHEHSLQGKAV